MPAKKKHTKGTIFNFWTTTRFSTELESLRKVQGNAHAVGARSTSERALFRRESEVSVSTDDGADAGAGIEPA
eukprot:COSAG03_NODE_109_length_12541_cov_147.127070_5_plen_73_part_00